MRIQVNILNEIIKKNFIWIIIYFTLIISSIMSLSFIKDYIDIEKQIESLLFMPNKFTILNIYQIVFIIYFIYKFYTFEFKNSFENIVLRIKDKKWFINKLIFLFIINIMIRLICFFLIYLFFSNHFTFYYQHIILPILYYISVSLITITLINLFKYKDIIIFLITILLSYLLFKFYNIYFDIMVLFLMLILNILLFNFKKILN